MLFVRSTTSSVISPIYTKIIIYAYICLINKITHVNIETGSINFGSSSFREAHFTNDDFTLACYYAYFNDLSFSQSNIVRLQLTNEAINYVSIDKYAFYSCANLEEISMLQLDTRLLQAAQNLMMLL